MLFPPSVPPPAQRARDKNWPTDATREPRGYLMSKDHVIWDAERDDSDVVVDGDDRSHRVGLCGLLDTFLE